MPQAYTRCPNSRVLHVVEGPIKRLKSTQHMTCITDPSWRNATGPNEFAKSWVSNKRVAVQLVPRKGLTISLKASNFRVQYNHCQYILQGTHAVHKLLNLIAQVHRHFTQKDD